MSPTQASPVESRAPLSAPDALESFPTPASESTVALDLGATTINGVAHSTEPSDLHGHALGLGSGLRISGEAITNTATNGHAVTLGHGSLAHVHANGHSNGHANGHVNGQNGHANGHANGHSNGSSNGHVLVNGHANGHANGHSNGHANGHSNGHSNGHANGHSNGHANGNGSAVKAITMNLGAAGPAAFRVQGDAPSCAECGSIMVRNGSCYKCLNCGSTSGCS